MEMCYDGALVMPSSYAVMDTEEMTYVEGGGEITINRKSIQKAAMTVWNIANGVAFFANLSAKEIGLKIVGSAYKFGKALLKLSGFGGWALQAAACAVAGTLVASVMVIGIVYVTDSSMTISW